jgi:hypothetical protein
MPYMTVGECASEIARELGVELNPRVLSDALYRGLLDTSCCPLVGNRRMIARERLPEVIRSLQRAGKLKREAA